MTDLKGKYIVEITRAPLPTQPLETGHLPQRTDATSLSAAFPTLDAAIDAAERRIKAGYEVHILHPDGSLMRHNEILRELERRAAGRPA